MRLFAIAFLSACAVACAGQPAAKPATAADGTAGGASAAKMTDNGNKLICTDEPQTGTRLTHHRVCATAEQWSERRQRDQDALEQLRQQAAH